jgi:hypothetical protein
MVGEALTVFQGRKPEPFKIRVLAVLRNFLPKQDVILIRAEDPRLEKTGIAAGMSGSPVYVDGRLMGAIAYGWNFAKEPLGGVTPIEAMLATRALPRRASAKTTTADANGIHTLTIADGGPGARAAAPFDVDAPDREVALAPSAAGVPQLRPVAIPLAVAGFDARTVAEMEQTLRPFGMVPVRAGGGRRIENVGPGRVEPGSAIGVELVRGDMSVVGTGTVTYVDKDTVLAFGHPMLSAGEMYLPLVDAEIHAILPSVSQSIKLSSPLAEVGALVQDRKACILGDLATRITMVPVTVRVKGPGAPERVFHAEVARHRRLTPMLAALVASSAVADTEPDAVDMVINVASNVKLQGQAPLDLRDQFFSTDGVSSSVLSSLRGLRAVGELLSNPFEPVVLEHIDITIGLEFRRDVVEIVGAAVRDGIVRAGRPLALAVTLRPYDGPEYTELFRVPVPPTVAGQSIKIEVASGAAVRPDTPQPESLAGYLDALTKYYPSSSLVVTVQTLEDGLSTRGRLLPDLPSAALDTLRSSGRARRSDSYRVSDKTAFPTKRIVLGRQDLTVTVDGDVLGKTAGR